MTPGPGQTHGLVSTYKSGCRCEPCQAARRTYYADRGFGTGMSRTEYLASISATPGGTHGRISCYQHGCRCDHCRDAARQARARQRANARRRQAQATRRPVPPGRIGGVR